MPNIGVYIPQKLVDEYNALKKEMGDDARGLSVAAQRGIKREVTRLKTLKKNKETER